MRGVIEVGILYLDVVEPGGEVYLRLHQVVDAAVDDPLLAVNEEPRGAQLLGAEGAGRPPRDVELSLPLDGIRPGAGCGGSRTRLQIMRPVVGGPSKVVPGRIWKTE